MKRAIATSALVLLLVAMLSPAASVASLLLTTEALITDLPEEKPAAAPAMPHGDMY